MNPMDDRHAAAWALANARLDRPLTAAEQNALRCHLEDCQACRSAVHELAALHTRLHASLGRPEVEPPRPLLARMIERNRRNAMQQRIISTGRIFAAGAAVVALVAVLIFALTQLRPRPAIPGQPGSATASQAPAVQEPPDTPTPSMAAVAPVADPPTATPAPDDPLSVLPTDYAQYTSADHNLIIAYPSAWQPTSDLAFAGEDGRWQLDVLPLDGMDFTRACEWEANLSPDRLDHYGDTPTIQLVTTRGEIGGCWVHTSRSSEAGSPALVFESPGQPGKILALRTDPVHFLEISERMRLAGPPAPRVASETVVQPGAPLGEPDLRRITVGPLTWDEYAISYAAEDQPGHFEYNDRIPEDVRLRYEPANGDTQALAASNQALEPYGYALEQVSQTSDGSGQGVFYHLLKGGEPVLQDIQSYSPVSIDSTGANWVLTAETFSGQRYQVRSGEVLPVENSPAAPFYFGPAYAGDRLTEAQIRSMEDGTSRVWVLQDGERVFDYALSGPFVKNPLEAFGAWDGHWAVEINGFLFVDGELVNDDLQASEIFNWQRLGGRPFFFFVRDGVTHAWYDGQELPGFQYERIFHGECCEPAIHNPRSQANLVQFAGLREGIWYYAALSAPWAQTQ